MGEFEWFRFFQNVTRDDETLHLRCAFANFAKFCVAQVTFDRKIAAVTVTAVNLHRAIANPHG